MAIFVDKLTEWVHLKPCKISSDGQDWADKFMDSVNVNQGMTGHVLSDRGPQLRGEFDQGLARLHLGSDITLQAIVKQHNCLYTSYT